MNKKTIRDIDVNGKKVRTTTMTMNTGNNSSYVEVRHWFVSGNKVFNIKSDDYSKESVTEKQINEYYDKYYVGDIEAKHILITVDVDSSATSDEKTEAYNAVCIKFPSIPRPRPIP